MLTSEEGGKGQIVMDNEDITDGVINQEYVEKGLIPLPTYRGKQFTLLSPGELGDLVSHCYICSTKNMSPDSRLRHFQSEHKEEYSRDIRRNCFTILNNYKHGCKMGMSILQQEAYLMATLETSRLSPGSPLDRLHHDVVFRDKIITPEFFSRLLNMLDIKHQKFERLVRVMTRSCTTMHRNCPTTIKIFFQSEGFFKQYIHINKIIDEIWMMRKEEPVQIQVWKMKHKIIFIFRSKLLKFLQKQFDHNWVENLKKTAENGRVKVWLLTEGTSRADQGHTQDFLEDF